MLAAKALTKTPISDIMKTAIVKAGSSATAASLIQGHIANFDLHFNELKVFDGETELLSEEL